MHRGQLEEVADKEELEPTEGLLGPTDFLAEFIEFVDEFGGEHGDFVDDQEVSEEPLLHDFSVTTDFGVEFLDGSLAEPDAGPGVEGFGLVAEKERRAAGHGAELDAREPWIGFAALQSDVAHAPREFSIEYG
uniref:Uncharacterized protein n=1 Tax=viral metagenome TaxID=1070528 RepID=A0A6C0HK65_9ZZZZ